MDAIEGVWSLIDSRAWNESTNRLSVPYASDPIGQLVFSRGRMLMSIWHGDGALGTHREPGFICYGGRYSFDGSSLECEVAVASDPCWIGGQQVRSIVMLGDVEMLWRLPARVYGTQLTRRELIWGRVCRAEVFAAGSRTCPGPHSRLF